MATRRDFLQATAGAITGLVFTLLIGIRWRTSMWQRAPLTTGRPSLPQRV